MPVEVIHMSVEISGSNGSILNDVKISLGLEEHYDAFDDQIILLINSAFTTLLQLGVGPAGGFSITGPNETWSDFLGDRLGEMRAVHDWIYVYVRKLFDPPENSSLMNAMNDLLDELTWRLNVQAESGITE